MKNSELTIIFVILIVLIGMFLRLFNLEKTASFDADQENFAWTAVRIIEGKRPVLIGIKAGEFPVFIGPLMYYIYSLFYFIFSMDPIGVNYLSLIFAFFTMISLFFVVKEIFGLKTGIFTLLVYSYSALFINYDRQVWLPNQLILTSIWIFYFLYKLNNKQQIKWLVSLGLLLSFGFQLHLTVLLFWPIVILGILIKKVKLRKNPIIWGAFSGVLGFLPVFLFDLRHNFLNLKGWLTLLNRTGGKVNIFIRLKALIRYTLENEVRIFSLEISRLTLIIAFLFFAFWLIKSLKKKKEALVLKLAFLWIIVPIIVFSPLNIHTPEYFFIINFPILIFISAFIFKQLSKSFLGNIIVFIFLTVFMFFNTNKVLTQQTENLISLYYKKEMVNYILQKAEGKDFSVYYETDRGWDYGFDYLFYWKLGKVPQKEEQAEFTIVVPWNYKNLELSERLGGIGVINNLK